MDKAEALALVAKAMTEAELQRKIMKAARDLHWVIYHTQFSVGSQAGWPDLCLVSTQQHRLLYRELKRETGTVTEPQRRWLATLTEAGEDAAVWRPSDLLSGKIVKELSPHGVAGQGRVPGGGR